jgi:ribonuclease HI
MATWWCNTDGAASDNQSRTVRKAGAGVYFSHCNPRNLSLALPGRVQTNQRAELYAALRVLQMCLHKVEIRTDSKYVLDGATKYRHTWRTRGWRSRRGSDLRNQDLWTELDSLLETRPAWAVRFIKVKGHSTWDDVASGGVSAVDKIGNDAADALAVAGARLHSLPVESDHLEAKWRMLVTRDVQRMMVEILADRQQRAAAAQPKEEAATQSVSDSSSQDFSEENSDDDDSGGPVVIVAPRRRRGRAAPNAPD